MEGPARSSSPRFVRRSDGTAKADFRNDTYCGKPDKLLVCNKPLRNSDSILTVLQPMQTEKQIGVGTWLGMARAFAVLSGASSAARVQCIKEIRDSKAYADIGLTWEEFCRIHIGISRPHAESLIHQYEKFGDAYFRLSDIARVSPQTYQQIAPHAEGDFIEIDGQKLALKPENGYKIRAAIQSLRNRIKEAPVAKRPPAGLVEVSIRVDALTADIDKAMRNTQNHAAVRDLLSHALRRFESVLRLAESRPLRPEQLPMS